MSVLREESKRLVLRYAPTGQFTFRHFRMNASDRQLYDLATQLNAFQVCDIDKILKVQSFTF